MEGRQHFTSRTMCNPQIFGPELKLLQSICHNSNVEVLCQRKALDSFEALCVFSELSSRSSAAPDVSNARISEATEFIEQTWRASKSVMTSKNGQRARVWKLSGGRWEGREITGGARRGGEGERRTGQIRWPARRTWRACCVHTSHLPLAEAVNLKSYYHWGRAADARGERERAEGEGRKKGRRRKDATWRSEGEFSRAMTVKAAILIVGREIAASARLMARRPPSFSAFILLRSSRTSVLPLLFSLYQFTPSFSFLTCTSLFFPVIYLHSFPFYIDMLLNIQYRKRDSLAT